MARCQGMLKCSGTPPTRMGPAGRVPSPVTAAGANTAWTAEASTVRAAVAAACFQVHATPYIRWIENSYMGVGGRGGGHRRPSEQPMANNKDTPYFSRVACGPMWSERASLVVERGVLDQTPFHARRSRKRRKDYCLMGGHLQLHRCNPGRLLHARPRGCPSVLWVLLLVSP